MTDDPANPTNTTPPKPGIGFGVFLVLAGCALLAQRLGFVPKGADWLLPAVLIAWGLGELYQRLRPR